MKPNREIRKKEQSERMVVGAGVRGGEGVRRG